VCRAIGFFGCRFDSVSPVERLLLDNFRTLDTIWAITRPLRTCELEKVVFSLPSMPGILLLASTMSVRQPSLSPSCWSQATKRAVKARDSNHSSTFSIPHFPWHLRRRGLQKVVLIDLQTPKAILRLVESRSSRHWGVFHLWGSEVGLISLMVLRHQCLASTASERQSTNTSENTGRIFAIDR